MPVARPLGSFLPNDAPTNTNIMKTTILQSLAVLGFVVALTNCTAYVAPPSPTTTSSTTSTATDTMYAPSTMTTKRTTTTY